MFTVKVFTSAEFRDLYISLYENITAKGINPMSGIKYFSFDDFASCCSPKNYDKNLRFITAFSEKEIIGVAKIAYYDLTKSYGLSYISVRDEYKNIGVASALLECTIKYFAEKYPGKKLNPSGYTVDGWKYLRNKFNSYCNKYGVKFNDRAIEYVAEWNEETRKLYNESKLIINNNLC